MAIIKKTNTKTKKNTGEDGGEKGKLIQLLIRQYISPAPIEISMKFPQKTKNRITVSFYYVSHITRETHTHPCLLYHHFTIPKLWNQLRCPSTDEWIKKMWYIYTMEFYSAIKRMKLCQFSVKWMEPEIIMLSKIS
jgi:hypothetical protein